MFKHLLRGGKLGEGRVKTLIIIVERRGCYLELNKPLYQGQKLSISLESLDWDEPITNLNSQFLLLPPW